MNATQWERQARQLADEQAARTTSPEAAEAERGGIAVPTVAQLRQSLVEIDQLFRAAPTPIKQRYKQITEADLRTLTDEARTALDDGSLGWLERDMVEAAAAQARALDRHLFEHREPRGKPDDPATDFLCVAKQTHVIPRPLATPPEDPAGLTTLTFRRRGLVWHRLIPQEIEGYTVDLRWYPDLSLSFRKPDAKVVGALFRDLSLVRDTAFDHFVAADAPCADEAATLKEQADAAFASDVLVALWPELTMPPVRRDLLVAELRQRTLANGPGSGPVVVAAGSWHEVEGTVVHNRLHVLSGAGRARFFHDKSLPLESKSLGIEQLTPSYRIQVLIAEDVLVAFAICRDFCEAQITQIYLAIDVDLVVVPSYGDTKTILAHRHQANQLSTDPGTRAFVVQQVIPDGSSPSIDGFVLAPDADLAGASPETMIAGPPVSAHPISFKRV